MWADFIADLRARSPAPAPATEEKPVPAGPSSRRWQVLSCALALAWLSTTIYSHQEVLYGTLFHMPMPEEPIYTPLVVNTTSATLFLDDFALSPLTLGPSLSPLALLPIAFILLLLALYHHHKLTSSSLKRPRSRSRSPSPLLELNPSSIESARALLPTAIEAYHSGSLSRAIIEFTTISHLGCAPADKAASCEWLGRAQYRLASRTGEKERMEAAKKAFERAVRMDPASATARASLGRVSFRLGRAEDAVKQLLGAIKRDEGLAFAHEYLGKACAALSIVEGGAKQWINAEEHLRRAIALDPTAYTTLAFLGEQLHTRGQTQEARPLLEQAISLRQDYPAAHARLAFLATEQMDPARAATHLALVLSTRESGFHDPDLLPSTRSSLLGPTPFLSLYFALPTTDSSARLDVLHRARKLYPSSTLLSILHCITQRHSHATSVKTSLEGLLALESTLAKRVERFGADDLEGKGLWALCLLGLNRGKKAERVYAEFWEGLRERKSVGGAGEERELAQLVMAFYDCRSTRRVAAGRRKEM